MIPEYLLPILLFFHLGLHARHGTDDRVGATCALFTILYGQTVVDHTLHGTAIFGQGETRTMGVVSQHSVTGVDYIFMPPSTSITCPDT